MGACELHTFFKLLTFLMIQEAVHRRDVGSGNPLEHAVGGLYGVLGVP